MMVLIECPSISLCVQVEGSRVVVGVRKKFEETRIGEFRRAHARMHAIDFQAGSKVFREFAVISKLGIDWLSNAQLQSGQICHGGSTAPLRSLLHSNERCCLLLRIGYHDTRL